jgi:AcrR family transcriptional regulator
MVHARFRRLPPERRDAILELAAEHFASAGFEGASYNRILESAGLSKSSAYTLFDGKADLYAAVLERELGLLSELVPPDPPLFGRRPEGRSAFQPSPPDPLSFWAYVRRWFVSSLETLGRHPRTARLLSGYADARRRGVVEDLDARIGAPFAGAVREIITTGRALGAVRTDQSLELLEALTGVVLSVLDQHHLASPATADAELYVDTLRRLLEP